MSNPRRIQYIIEPEYVMEGAGVRLRRSFQPSIEHHFDPFLLFDHFAFNDPRQGPIMGFPMHPHRGIETVTYMLEGFTRHRDSMGNVDTIGPGDIQWMTSGRGILHEEMPRRGENGLIVGFQLWVNLPAGKKWVAPRYQGVVADEIPTVELDGGRARVVAGTFAGVTGPVTEIAADPLYMDVTVDAGREIEIPVPPGHTAIVYLFEGEGLFAASENAAPGSSPVALGFSPGIPILVPAVHMLIFGDGDHIRIGAAADSHARFMLMAGAPFNEPIFPYGPFVMNTREEIVQAFAELRNGTFIK